MKQIISLKKTRGFTIVEVMIVLAIAGVIMSIVFLAVPQLQRSARNSQRDTDANNFVSAVNECLSNNNGSVTSTCFPSAAADTATAPSTYGNGTSDIIKASGYLDLTKITQLTSITVNTQTNTTAAVPSGTAAMAVFVGNICSNGAPTTTGAGPNNFVVLYNRETKSSTIPVCISP